MARQKRQCESCGSVVSLSNFERHRNSVACRNGGKGKTKVEKHSWEDWKIGENLFRLPCGYVGTKRACCNKMNNQRSIEKNPEGNFAGYLAQVRSGARGVHNKGLSLPERQREKISKAIKQYHVVNGDSAVSDKTRKRLSEARTRFLHGNPQAHINARVAGNRSKMTYPERVANDWFKFQNIPAIHNQRVGRFFPDFTVGKTIIEIDGEQWHSSPEQRARDEKRDAILMSLGFTVYRIPSKEPIEKRLREIFQSQFELA